MTHIGETSHARERVFVARSLAARWVPAQGRGAHSDTRDPQRSAQNQTRPNVKFISILPCPAGNGSFRLVTHRRHKQRLQPRPTPDSSLCSATLALLSLSPQISRPLHLNRESKTLVGKVRFRRLKRTKKIAARFLARLSVALPTIGLCEADGDERENRTDRAFSPKSSTTAEVGKPRVFHDATIGIEVAFVESGWSLKYLTRNLKWTYAYVRQTYRKLRRNEQGTQDTLCGICS